jgi:hypothetical protein
LATGGDDYTAPYASQWYPPKSSTGRPISDRRIEFHIQDGVDVLTANGVVNIEGDNVVCGAGLTCTGGTTDKTIVYTKGSDWGFLQTVNISTTGFRDSAGNIMSADTWSFVTEDSPAGELNITTTSPLTTRTKGVPFTQTFTATGGTEPYVWSVISGTVPTGTALSPAGVFAGTPTTPSSYNFTAHVVDSGTSGTSDNQAFTVTVNPALPGTPVTKTIPTDIGSFSDTHISGEVNNSTSTLVKTYQFPAESPANIVIDNIVLGLPDNIAIQSAQLWMRLDSWYGNGGDSSMNVYAYRISEPVDVTTIVWSTFNLGWKNAYESVTAIPLTPGWYYWDVTTMTQWAYTNSSPLYVALDGGTTGSIDTNRLFVSREGTSGYRPYLVVTYMPLTQGGVPISAPGKMRVSKMKGTFR